MRETPLYTEFHPRWYRVRVSTFWWLVRWPYLRFILREISSVFVACFVLITLLQIRALSQGSEVFAAFERRMSHPLLVLFNVVTFLFVVFHAVTWFNLTPKAMSARFRGKRVPGLLIAAPNYVAWVAVSAAVAWFVLEG